MKLDISSSCGAVAVASGSERSCSSKAYLIWCEQIKGVIEWWDSVMC